MKTIYTLILMLFVTMQMVFYMCGKINMQLALEARDQQMLVVRTMQLQQAQMEQQP